MSFVKSKAEILNKRRESLALLDAEVLTLVWKTRPEIIQRLLPPTLSPAKEPIVTASIARYPQTNFGIRYHEAGLFIRCSYNGEEGHHCLSMPVDNDIAMASGREIFGFPRKMARIQFRKDKDHLFGSIERHGREFVQLEADLYQTPNNTADMMRHLSSTAATPDEIIGLTFNIKNFPSITGEGFDYPPKLVRHETLIKVKTLGIGRGSIKLMLTDHDPWAELEVIEMLGAFYTRGNNYMLKGQEVAAINPEEFSPYSYRQWDSELIPY